MYDFEPNYSDYSYQELLDAYSDIDKEQFPERYKLLVAELESRQDSQREENTIFVRAEAIRYRVIGETFNWIKFFTMVVTIVFVSQLDIRDGLMGLKTEYTLKSIAIFVVYLIFTAIERTQISHIMHALEQKKKKR